LFKVLLVKKAGIINLPRDLEGDMNDMNELAGRMAASLKVHDPDMLVKHLRCLDDKCLLFLNTLKEESVQYQGLMGASFREFVSRWLTTLPSGKIPWCEAANYQQYLVHGGWYVSGGDENDENAIDESETGSTTVNPIHTDEEPEGASAGTFFDAQANLFDAASAECSGHLNRVGDLLAKKVGAGEIGQVVQRVSALLVDLNELRSITDVSVGSEDDSSAKVRRGDTGVGVDSGELYDAATSLMECFDQHGLQLSQLSSLLDVTEPVLTGWKNGSLSSLTRQNDEISLQVVKNAPRVLDYLLQQQEPRVPVTPQEEVDLNEQHLIAIQETKDRMEAERREYQREQQKMTEQSDQILRGLREQLARVTQENEDMKNTMAALERASNMKVHLNPKS